MRFTGSLIYATAYVGTAILIFKLDGTLKQYINTYSTSYRRSTIMFLNDDYLITGFSTSSTYNPTIYEYSDPSWNKITSIGNMLPIGDLTPVNTTSPRYGNFYAQYNNDFVFSQTYVDQGNGASTSQYGAIYYLKRSSQPISTIDTSRMEVNNIITKSINIVGGEIVLKNEDGTKLPASRLINSVDDFSCNTIEFNSLEEFNPKLLSTLQSNIATGYYNSLGNMRTDAMKLYGKFAIFGMENANYSRAHTEGSTTYYTGSYGAVVIMKKNANSWELHQTLSPFFGSNAFNNSQNTNNQTDFHGCDFGRAVEINKNYIVVGTSGDKGGIRIFKKTTNDIFLPLRTDVHVNIGTGTSSNSLVVGQLNVSPFKGYGDNITWNWRGGSNDAIGHTSHTNSMVITDDNIIIVSENSSYLFAFYNNKKLLSDGTDSENTLEPYKWDMISIDISDLNTDTFKIGKIIHYGNSIVFCNAHNSLNQADKGFLYRYSYTVDSFGKPTFTYEQTFTMLSGLGFSLTQNDDYVFLANPLYTNNGYRIHFYKKK